LKTIGSDLDAKRPEFAKLVSGWLLSKLLGQMTEMKIDIRTCKITPENFAEFLTLVQMGKVNSTAAQEVLKAMLESGEDPSQIIAERGLEQVSDAGDLDLAAANVIAANPKVVADYRAGKQNAIMFLVGQVMKETRGKANPGVVKKILEDKLQGS
jgi:aspartyl-tRNA(Asn)/glutamyl-tRNA(Gln) amidotransferase subunit B